VLNFLSATLWDLCIINKCFLNSHFPQVRLHENEQKDKERMKANCIIGKEGKMNNI
jgi:hypothetical protein